MNRTLALAATLLLVLLACTLSGTPTPSPGAVATEVSRLLTLSPLAPSAAASAAASVLSSATAAPPTLTPIATASVTPTYTPPPTDPRLHLGKPDWRDTFDTGQNWYLAGANPNAEIRDGKLVFSVSEADNKDWWRLAAPKLANFYIDATATIGDCRGLDRYGVVLRAPDLTQGYLFGFTCDGRYSLRKWDGSQFTKVKDWTANPSILAGGGQTNRLGLMADGGRLSLYANGNFMYEVRDDQYGEGRFGLFIGASATPNLTVQFDELDYWLLP